MPYERRIARLGRTGLRGDPPRVRGRVRSADCSGRRRRPRRSRPSSTPGSSASATFDVAPLYGYGAAERRLGAALRAARATSTSCRPRSGAWSDPPTAIPPGADIDRQALDGSRRRVLRRRGAGASCSTTRADGVRRSLEESLERLGLDRVDIAYIHDPDDHWAGGDRRRLSGAPPAARGGRRPGDRRRDEPVGDARPGSPGRPRSTSFLVAGRYTLLDQDALDELLPVVRRARRSRCSSAG